MSPCKGCENRYIGCHSKCDDYKAFKDTRHQINENRKKESRITSFKVDAEIYTNKRMR